ncbi:MAG: hypothetical protein KBC30_05240 [Planctomycetes bacterium]|nr:hypothetical protein [Planctomycetota bacterium]HNZ66022.1 hypothetical protein [Planctomycetota bacterium]HON44258.1 hypothetical protein [Planctomycetota bacterium]HPY74394.1 hypothetical protein [Planctomycetota bacterium]HQA99946.1 hypothetical protein [Planctomycetota bacterium]
MFFFCYIVPFDIMNINILSNALNIMNINILSNVLDIMNINILSHGYVYQEDGECLLQ